MKRIVTVMLVYITTAITFNTNAQTFSLLKEINTQLPDNSLLGSTPRDLIRINSTIFFMAYTPGAGDELWKSDGTAAGTVMVKDIYSGPSPAVSSSTYYLTNVNGVLFFLADDGVHGRELWKSDGTTNGTVMVKDINPGVTGGPQSLLQTAVVNNTIYFAANDGTNGVELWKSDGTAAGTIMIKNINPGLNNSSPYEPINVNGVIFFSANDGTNGDELWKSNGTADGTQLVRNIHASSSSFPDFLTNLNGVLYFSARNESNTSSIWKSDGTSAGTTPVVNSGEVYLSPFDLVAANNLLFFTARRDSEGTELWRTDGTQAGTFRVKDIFSGTGSGSPSSMTNINGKLYFAARTDLNNNELWKSDGTEAGTVMVKDIRPGGSGSGPESFCLVNGTLYFRALTAEGKELWKTDGTETGTVMVKDIKPGPSDGLPVYGNKYLIELNGVLYFAGDDGVKGVELWKTDGTDAGTVMVKDLVPPYSGSAFPATSWMIKLNGIAYFAAYDALNGLELWKSDGTTDGTVLVKDLRPGVLSSNPMNPVVLNGVLYFNAYGSTVSNALWKTDGTTAGTVLVKDVSVSTGTIRSMGNNLYFAAFTSASGFELWKSDGTTVGTVMVKDIEPGATGSSPSDLTVVDDEIFFRARTTANGSELWKSLGTEVRTVMVKDIVAGVGSSDPTELTNINGTLYFSANNVTNGREPWSSNGLSIGTLLLYDVNPGTASSNPRLFRNIGTNIFYLANLPSSGEELWTYIPGIGNTMMQDINPGTGSSGIEDFINVNNTFYFKATNGVSGHELWKMDQNGLISFVKDIWPGSGDGVDTLFNVEGRLFLAGNNGINGSEPWRSDGTNAGTAMIQDVLPIGGSEPSAFTQLGTNLLAIMYDETHGRELWVANINEVLPLTLLEFNGKLVGDDALLEWKTTDEQNTLSFEVERSVDGRNYTSIGSLSAANSSGIHSYSLTDYKVQNLVATTLFYRLKQKDIDGRVTYSRTVLLPLSQKHQTVLIYPNPVVNELNLTITLNKSEKIQARVLDNSGRIIFQKQLNLSQGTTSLSFDMSQFARGAYYLELKGEEMNEVKRFLKN